jgi:hypothetical protein
MCSAESVFPVLLSKNPEEGFGTSHLRLERVRHHDPGRDGSLRHDEDGAAGYLSRHGGTDEGDEGHNEYSSSGSNHSEGIVGFLQSMASNPNAPAEQAEQEFFEKH